ncbi:MAG: hypothetical protein KAW12_09785 [Candidatus Aminicenantes bacterium]|nr:hypothetical protein [Candidatus Aminicenantes bacterium]
MKKTDFIIKPNDEDLLRTMEITGSIKSVERMKKNKKFRVDYEAAKKELVESAAPVLCWNRFPIKEIVGNQVVLKNGAKIGRGPVAKVVAGAQELILGVCTIGMKTERKSEEYMKGAAMMKGFILDALASWAVDSVRAQFYEWIKKEFFKKEGLRTSSMLWPGNSWPIEEQAEIFKILGNETGEIGVSLTASMMMAPKKSLSFLLGAGKNPLGSEDSLQCEFCPDRPGCKAYKIRMNRHL